MLSMCCLNVLFKWNIRRRGAPLANIVMEPCYNYNSEHYMM